ncbi:MAG: polysaccharide deacetylase family protein [Nanoarchaeota archaeon]|nr:polysaccharide deacetylase family protein [Nanoarchaeota archaeon]
MNRVMSVDLEYDFDSKKSESVSEVIPKLLNLFDDFDVKATFFVVGELVDKYETLIREIGEKHEIGSHSQTHPRLDGVDIKRLNFEVAESKKQIEKLGFKCNGFRSPFMKPHKMLMQTLKNNGYTYDSSFSSSHPPFFVNPLIKTKPYKKHVIELPADQFFWKMVPTSFFYYRFLYPWSKSFKEPYMFYLHPCELQMNLDLGSMPMWRKMFYKRNLGKNSWKILREFFENSNSKWVSCMDFVKFRGLF